MYTTRYWHYSTTMSLTKHMSMPRLISYQVSAVLADSEFWWWAGKNGSRLSPSQLLCEPAWCPRSRGWVGLVLSHAGGSAGLGAGALTLLYVLAQEGCQLWKATVQHLQAANAESSSSCSDFSLGCYQLPLKTRFLPQLQYLKDAFCWNAGQNCRMSTELMDVSPIEKGRLESW